MQNTENKQALKTLNLIKLKHEVKISLIYVYVLEVAEVDPTHELDLKDSQPNPTLTKNWTKILNPNLKWPNLGWLILNLDLTQ